MIVIGAPYSGVATTEEVTNLLGGKRIVKKEVVRWYRDGQGRTRVEWPRARSAGSPGHDAAFDIAMIADPLSGEFYNLSSSKKTARVLRLISEGPRRPPSITPPVAMPAYQPKLTVLGERTLEGVKAVGTLFEYTIEASSVRNEQPITITTEQWFGLQLGVVIASTSRSSSGHETTYRLEQIVPGEPDASLFQIPPGYARSPVGQLRSCRS